MFYTYLYKDPRPTKLQQVVYVGKGQGNRARFHWEKGVKHNSGFSNFLSLLRKTCLEPSIEIVGRFDTEVEAHADEIRLIALYGRRDLKTGTLFNLTDGGEGTTGAIRTDDWRSNISKALLTPEHVSRQSAAKIKLWADPQHRSRVTASIGKAVKSPEVKAIRAKAIEGYIHTDEFKATMSEASKKVWRRAGHKERTLVAMLAGNARPEVKAKKSENSKQTWARVGATMAASIKTARNTVESKAKTSAQAKAQWADPEYAAMQKANNKEIASRPEVKAAKAAALRARWADPEQRALLMAARAKPTP